MTYTTYRDAAQKLQDDREGNFWKATAKGYDAWIASDFQDQYEINLALLLKYMQPSRRVLDVGCGPGSLSLRLASHCHEILGVDVTPEMIEIAEEKLAGKQANASFHHADACDLPFENHSFDTAMSVNALQTMSHPEMALAEMHRVLKPAGELLLITYCYGDSTHMEHQSLLDWAVQYDGRAMWHCFKLTQLAELLQNTGFEVVEATRIWEGPVVGFLRGRALV